MSRDKGNINTRAVQVARDRMKKAIGISCAMCDTPFMQKPITEVRQLKDFDNLTPEKIEDMIKTKGWDATEEYIRSMEMLKHKKGG